MYRILSLTLVFCNRLFVGEIRKITITPTSAIQLILGTNGCGKSSLLEQMTPLPADKHDFEKGGSKTIEIESHGHHFVCASYMDKDMTHSFVMDGEELNEGGTATVQRDLCKKHFNVTPDSHDLVRGVIKFTDLKPTERQQWLMSMCSASSEFAMGAYEQLKKRANHLTGAVNMNTKNLVTEVAKIMSDEEEAKLEKEVNELLAELDILQAERMPVEKSSAYHLDERGKALHALQEVSMRLLRNRVVVPYEYNDGRMERDEWGQPKRVYFGSIAEIDSEIDRLKHIVTAKENQLIVVNEQYTKLQRQLDILTKTGAEGVESLRKKIETQHQLMLQRSSNMRLGLVFGDARSALQALDTIELPLTTLLRDLPINSEVDDPAAGRKYGRSRYDGTQQQMLKLTEQMNQHVEMMHRLQAQQDHADLHRNDSKQTCPRCEHTWTTGVNETQYAAIVEQIKQARLKYQTMQTVHQALKKDLDEVTAYFTQYREVMTYTKTVGALKPFWDHLIATNNITESPMDAVTLVQQLRRDLAIAIEIQEMNEAVVELTRLRAQAEEVGDANLNEVREQMEVLTHQLGGLTGALTQVQRAVAEYSEYRRQLNTGIQLGEEVKRLYGLAQQQQYDQIEAFRRESILHCLREVENALSLKQESLRAAKRQKELVALLREQIAKQKIHEAAAKAMVSAISPKNGLIAQGLLGFIRAFVGEMNTLLNRFWKYPLQVIPTGYDTVNREQTADLDYKFKLMVERENNIKKDVSMGSEGIKEAINWAFQKVGIKYLNLEGTPWMLDEPGRTFDDEHRISLTQEIIWTMENTNHPQLFIISHYAASYSAFSNAQMCVVDDRNVVLPSGKVYNEHVQIVH